ncbi:arsenic resistance protein [Shouchella clausii]|uniref:arsenic resistance protein n=1 Tax=Shouchella clausii TaxID=79880 RepID=UPI000798BBA0|nr:bile acid:sodium symporter [Shouchella clausii]KKI86848.1 arsenic resistance protein [Shouchella clausii]
MDRLEKYQTGILFIAVIVGVCLGQIAPIAQSAEMLILPFLLLMLYGLFLNIPLKQIKQSFQHKRFFWASLLLNFVWTPLLAWGLGAVFLNDHPALWLGFILLLVTPCTDWYLVFTAMAKGNVPLAASLLPVNLLLQLLLLPLYLLLFGGTTELPSLQSAAQGAMGVLVIPFALAYGTRGVLKKRKRFLEQKLVPFFSSAQLLFLTLAVMALFASQSQSLFQHASHLLSLLLPIFLFFIINFCIALATGKWLSFSYKDTASLQLTVLARNSPLALAVVVAAFPGEPFIALALVIGPLLELPILALVTYALLHIKKRTQVFI